MRNSKSEGEGSFMGAGVAAESVLAAVDCSRMQNDFRKRRESKNNIEQDISCEESGEAGKDLSELECAGEDRTVQYSKYYTWGIAQKRKTSSVLSIAMYSMHSGTHSKASVIISFKHATAFPLFSGLASSPSSPAAVYFIHTCSCYK